MSFSRRINWHSDPNDINPVSRAPTMCQASLGAKWIWNPAICFQVRDLHSLAAWWSALPLESQNNQFWQERSRYASNYKNTQISWQPDKVRKRITSLLFLTYLFSSVKLACSIGNLWPQCCVYQSRTSENPLFTIATQSPFCNEPELQSLLVWGKV